MQRLWREIEQDGRPPQWAGLYVTMNSKGSIVMTRNAHQRMGSPAAFALLYDSANNAIGLRPAEASTPNAYKAHKSGRHGGRTINAYRLLVECSLRIAQTLEFSDAEIDPDGILILNLRTAKVSNRGLNHPKRRAAKTQPRGEPV